MPRPPAPADAFTTTGYPRRWACTHATSKRRRRLPAPRRHRAARPARPGAWRRSCRRSAGWPGAVGPMNVTPSRSHSSTKSARSATKPQPGPDGVGLHGHERLLQARVVEVGRLPLAVRLVHEGGRAEVIRLVGLPDEARAPVGIREQGDRRDARAALEVELADGVDDAHGRLAAVDDGHALEICGHDDLGLDEEGGPTAGVARQSPSFYLIARRGRTGERPADAGRLSPSARRPSCARILSPTGGRPPIRSEDTL